MAQSRRGRSAFKASAHPHYRSLRRTSPVILTNREARNAEPRCSGLYGSNAQIAAIPVTANAALIALADSASLSRERERGAGASPVDRLESPPIDAKLDEVVLEVHPDHQRQRLLEVRAAGGHCPIVDRGRIDAGHDRGLAVVGMGPVLEPR